MERSEGRDFTDGSSEIVQKTPLLVSCIWCEKLHRAEHPLEFNPVCSTCAARYSIMRSLEMKERSAEAAFEKECRNCGDFRGSGELDNEAHPVRTPPSSSTWPIP